MDQQQRSNAKYASVLAAFLVLAGLYLLSTFNFLLFHALAELFSITIAFCVFVIAWNTRRWLNNNYLLLVGIAYLFVGGIDVLHTLAYRGIGVFPATDSNIPTQLWIAARYLQAVSLLAAPFFLSRTMRAHRVFAGYTLIVVLLLGAVFTGLFPDCYIEGVGLTPFKKISEYVVSVLLLAAIVPLLRQRAAFDGEILRLLVWSLVATVLSELAFTFYVDVYGFSNLVGHFFKIVAFYLVYQAIIGRGLSQPYALFFKELDYGRRELEAERDKARRYLDVVGAVVVAIDRDQIVTLINRAGCAILGYPEQDVVGQNWFDRFVPADVRERTRAIFVRLMDGEIAPTTSYFENTLITQSGVERLIAWHNTVLTDAHGRISGTLSSGEDITERRHAEMTLAWEAGTNAAMTELAKAMIASDSLDEVSRRVLEYALNLTGSAFGFVGYIDPQTGYMISPTLTQDIWGTCQVPNKTFVFERFAGLWGWVLNHHQSLMTNDPASDLRSTGVPAGHIPIERFLSAPALLGESLVGIVALANSQRAYTERDQALVERLASLYALAIQQKRAEDALRLAKENAEAANRAKSIFLANMSHELRTPLNAILGFTQLMVNDARLDASQRENLDTINRSGEHLLTLINDVLAMSKIEAGRVALNPQSFDLHLLLEGLEEMFALLAHQKGLQVILDRASDVPRYVHTDENKLRQVLTNLLGNAVKFTTEGGVTLRVGAKEAVAGESDLRRPFDPTAQLYFEVEDTGTGIAPHEMDMLFDPFVQTTSGQASQEGTGLGLPISQQFVRLLGGELSAHSQLGKGSIFKFSVPVRVVSEDEIQDQLPQRKVVGLEPGQPSYRLLIVEDRPTNRRLLVRLLSPLGFELREAVDGQEAVEIWEAWQPHLIWMDLRMPVVDGYEATRRIKATAQGQATVIIALTASAFEDDRSLILSEGCDDFISKPFRPAELFDKLTQHLGVRFIYSDLAPSAQPAGDDVEVRPEALRRLPPDWLTAFRQATIQADFDQMVRLVEHVKTENPTLAHTLRDWVYSFEYNKILALLEGLEREHD
ncbi:MAG: response regulator [Anaerolineae bacterium]|nr:response regulator [Anaerolineae bacterium]